MSLSPSSSRVKTAAFDAILPPANYVLTTPDSTMCSSLLTMSSQLWLRTTQVANLSKKLPWIFEEVWNQLQLQRQETDGVILRHPQPQRIVNDRNPDLVEAAVDFEEVWNQLQLQRQETDGVILRHPQPQRIVNDRNPDLVEAAVDFEEVQNQLQLQRQETDGVFLRHPQPQHIANDCNPDLVSDTDSEEDGFWDLRPDWLERFRARRQQSENGLLMPRLIVPVVEV